jgi:hypothetical protein
MRGVIATACQEAAGGEIFDNVAHPADDAEKGPVGPHPRAVIMEKEEFVRDLPEVTECDRCRRKIKALDWHIGRFGALEWMGLCIVRCAKCGVYRVAAAGSSAESHHRAQMMRWELLVSLKTTSIL